MTEEGYKPRDIARANATASIGGRQAFAGEKALPQSPDSMFSNIERNFSVSLFFTPDTDLKIRELAGKVLDIAHEYGLVLRLAGRDIPIHMTLQTGRYFNTSGDPKKAEAEEQERLSLYGQMFRDATSEAHAERLIGQALELKYVLMRPDAIILTVIAIPPIMKAFRESIATASSRHRIKNAQNPQKDIVPIENMLHITLGRFLDPLPSQENFQRMRQAFIELRRELVKNPIVATIADIDFQAGRVLPFAYTSTAAT